MFQNIFISKKFKPKTMLTYLEYIMGGYLSYYASSKSEPASYKLLVTEPSNPKEVSDNSDNNDNIKCETNVQDLTTQIIEEHITKTEEIVTQINELIDSIESNQSIEEVKLDEKEQEQEEQQEQEEEQEKEEQNKEKQQGQEEQQQTEEEIKKPEESHQETFVEKKIEIDPVEVNKSADVTKKNKKKKKKKH